MRKRRVFQMISLLLCTILLLCACAEGSGGKSSESSSNTYKTPIAIAEELENSKRFTNTYDQIAKMLNGFGEQEIRSLLDVFKRVETYEDRVARAKLIFEENIQDMKDEYGSNYKISYKIEDKKQLEKEDLKHIREVLRDYADRYESLVEESEDYDSDDWSDEADDMGLSVSDAKKAYAALEDLAKLCRQAKVTDGYELTITKSITGSELDEPEERELTECVYKVDGRWVSETALSYLRAIAGF